MQQWPVRARTGVRALGRRGGRGPAQLAQGGGGGRDARAGELQREVQVGGSRGVAVRGGAWDGSGRRRQASRSSRPNASVLCGCRSHRLLQLPGSITTSVSSLFLSSCAAIRKIRHVPSLRGLSLFGFLACNCLLKPHCGMVTFSVTIHNVFVFNFSCGRLCCSWSVYFGRVWVVDDEDGDLVRILRAPLPAYCCFCIVSLPGFEVLLIFPDLIWYVGWLILDFVCDREY
jgi:hypothetical protein